MKSVFETYVYLTNNFAALIDYIKQESNLLLEDFVNTKTRIIAQASNHHSTASQLRLTWTNRFRMALEDNKGSLNDATRLKCDDEVWVKLLNEVNTR